MKVTLHRPRSEEIKLLEDFFTETITDTFAQEGVGHLKENISNEISEKMHYIEEDIKSEGMKRFYLIAKVRDKIVGTIGFGPPGSSVTETCDESISSYNEIGAVFVLPELQGKGLGTLLLNSMHACLLSRGVEKVVLDSGYKKAQKYWKNKLGEPVKILKDYWAEGVDHHVWLYEIEEIGISFRI